VLYLNHLRNTGAAEDVLAMGNDRIFQGINADGTFLLALYDELEGLLQEGSILVIELDNALLLKKLHQVGDPLFA
jgi:hypothetical protein